MDFEDDIFNEAELAEAENLMEEFEKDEDAFHSAKQDMEEDEIDPLF
jgi:hypothetical protein